MRLAIALGLGLLVGLQRETAAKDVAGIRSFTLISMTGFASALAAQRYGPALLVAALVAATATVVAGSLMRRRGGAVKMSVATEMAALLMFLVGASLVTGPISVPVFLAGTVAVLLQWKDPLHGTTERMGPAEVQAVFRLALIGLVILPVMPDEAYGPYEVLNPFRIWLVVVLIVGISLGAYTVARMVRPPHGLLAAGLLGGLISSTATTVASARESRRRPDAQATALSVILLASATVYVRLLVEMFVVSRDLFSAALGPFFVLMAFTVAMAFAAYKSAAPAAAGPYAKGEPPEMLRIAVVFGMLYAVVLLAVAAARQYFGVSGMYAVAALSGISDLDAITLSTAQFVELGRIEPAHGWRIVVVAYLANMAFKTAIAGFLGSPGLLRRVGLSLAVLAVVGSGLIALWP